MKELYQPNTVFSPKLKGYDATIPAHVLDVLGDTTTQLKSPPPEDPGLGQIATHATFAPGLTDTTVIAGNIPLIEIPHTQGCCCSGCGGMPVENSFLNATANPIEGSPLAAPSQLGDMADFLTTGYWAASGTVPRQFNMAGVGINAKSGVLHYNVGGFTNAGSAGSDADGLSAPRAGLVRDVLDVFGEVLGISFVETTSSDIAVTDLFFKDTDAGTAYANASGFSAGIQYSWINLSQDWSGGTSTYNDYTLQTIFHEVGHALGLGHQGSYNGSASFPLDADFDNDSWQASMMSYFSQVQNASIPANFAYLQTPMAVDWIALQDIYGPQSFGGVDFGVNNAFLGDTVYGFNTNIAASTSNIWAQYANYANTTASTIVDAGGIDTLDFSGYSANQMINLTPTGRLDTAPSISNIGGLTGNLTLAEGTIIENAIGGMGDDTFFGNDAANTLTGNGGDDLFYDSLGSDRYFGGAGSDTVSFLGQLSGYSFDISGTFLEVINVATDFLEDTIEFLRFDTQTLSLQDIIDGLSVNNAPMANDDTYLTGADGVLAGASILANDTDSEGDPLTVATVEGEILSDGAQIALASGALLSMAADGTFEYDPNGAFDTLGVGQDASDSFTYTATDGSDPSNTATVTITVSGVNEPVPPAPIGQSGVARVAQSGPEQWHTVSFAQEISNAVVVMGPATFMDADPMTTRVRNVTDTGFEFQIDEWNYLDGVHGLESIGWLAISEGSHRLNGGQNIVAATADVGTEFAALTFGAPMEDAIVLAEVSSLNGPAAVTTRIRNVSDTGFQVQIEEEEAGGAHVPETVSWIAIETGQNAEFDAFLTPNEVRNTVSTYAFSSGFAVPPVLLADMQTLDGGDTATTRLSSLDNAGVSLFIEEDQSANVETFHATEAVGVVAFKGGLLFAEELTNTPPIARDDMVNVAENAPLSIDVLANDTDTEGDTLIVAAIEGQTIDVGETMTLLSGASVTLNADQTLAYAQNGNFEALTAGQTAQDAFAYALADSDGAISGATVTVTIEGIDAATPAGLIGQSGVASVGQTGPDQWHSVTFDMTISDAVVVLGPATTNDGEALTTRVRNLSDTGFEFQIDEWDYLDGVHGVEDIGWLAISEGSHLLGTGQTIVASSASVGTDLTALSFGETLTNAIVFTEASTVNEADAMTTRVRGVTEQGFQVRIEEEQADGAHVAETVSWIAIESGAATGLEAGRTLEPVDDTGDTFIFTETFAETPVLLADLQSLNGGDTSTLRLTELDAQGGSMFLQEEQSADAEVVHVDEFAGYLALQSGLIYEDTFLI